MLVVGIAAATAWGRGDGDAEGPAYTPGGRLRLPADYREWAFVTSGLGMTYGPAKAAEPRFDNVFVTRAAYRDFLRTGTWPERTMFILEVRAAEANVSINRGGRTQGAVLAIEAAVKDRRRFPDGGWGYYSFDGKDDPAEALPATASCYACHREEGAVDNTFVQFYPTLLDAARRHGTVRPGHAPERAR
jgi:hypothetical protein